MELLFTLASAIIPIIMVIERRREAARAHPPLDYTPAPVAWRWSAPPDALTTVDGLPVAGGIQIRQTDDTSTLILPARRDRWQAILAESVGYVLGVLMVYVVSAGLIRGVDPLLHILPIVLFGPLAIGCVLYATRLDHIELRRDTVTFVEQAPLWWRRRRVRRRPMRISGGLQSVLSMEGGKAPQYDLLLGGRLWSVRFRIPCTQSTGSWILGGLEAWNRAELEWAE